jgi:hypothetical protein
MSLTALQVIETCTYNSEKDKVFTLNREINSTARLAEKMIVRQLVKKFTAVCRHGKSYRFTRPAAGKHPQ